MLKSLPIVCRTAMPASNLMQILIPHAITRFIMICMHCMHVKGKYEGCSWQIVLSICSVFPSWGQQNFFAALNSTRHDTATRFMPSTEKKTFNSGCPSRYKLVKLVQNVKKVQKINMVLSNKYTSFEIKSFEFHILGCQNWLIIFPCRK